MLWLRFWHTIHWGKRQINVFRFRSYHIITVGVVLPASCCRRQTGTDAVSPRSVSLNRRVAAACPSINSAVFKTHIRDTTYINITVFGPVTRLCQLKCLIFLIRQLSPARSSPPGSDWSIAFSAAAIIVSKHNARPRESNLLSGVGGVRFLF